jgi:hypothetical protein
LIENIFLVLDDSNVGTFYKGEEPVEFLRERRARRRKLRFPKDALSRFPFQIMKRLKYLMKRKPRLRLIFHFLLLFIMSRICSQFESLGPAPALPWTALWTSWQRGSGI